MVKSSVPPADSLAGVFRGPRAGKSASAFRALVAAALASLLLAGCQPPKTIAAQQPQPAGTLSVYQLASRLHLRVEESTANVATLSDGRNRVTIFGAPGGQVYVNGKPVGPPGSAFAIDDTMFIQQDVEIYIYNELRPSPGVVTPPPVGPQPLLPPSGPTAHGLVVLDPGHGAQDPGTRSVCDSCVKEKNIVLPIALMVADILRQRGVRVLLTRHDDTFIELSDRAALANRNNADLFVSIHANWISNESMHGFMVFVNRTRSSRSVAAAETIARHLEGVAVPYGSQPHDAGYRVLVQNERPACLIETGFLSNPSEAVRLASRDYQQRLAQAIADGIIDYLRH